MGPDVQIFFTNVIELVKKHTQQTIQVHLPLNLQLTFIQKLTWTKLKISFLISNIVIQFIVVKNKTKSVKCSAELRCWQGHAFNWSIDDEASTHEHSRCWNRMHHWFLIWAMWVMEIFFFFYKVMEFQNSHRRRYLSYLATQVIP